MGRKRKTQFGESLIDNVLDWRMYANRFTMLAIAMFEWKNLPDTVDPRFLELKLFEQGKVVFTYDDALGYVALPAAVGGTLNIYGIPIQRNLIGMNGAQLKRDETNSVVIWNNFLHTNSILEVEEYSKRLYVVDRTIDTNVKAQRTPVLIKCSEKDKLTMLNLYKEYDGNQPFIFGDKNLDTAAFNVLKTDAPFVTKQLYEYRTQLYNECLTMLGISNISYQKKERLISDEVIRSQGGTIANRYTRLETRRQACKEINKMFGLNIECDYREDFRSLDNDSIDISDSDMDTEGNDTPKVVDDNE